jgi:hypothetical protein
MKNGKMLRLIGVTVWAWISVIFSVWALVGVFGAWLVPGGEGEIVWRLGMDVFFVGLSILFAHSAKHAFRKRRNFWGDKKTQMEKTSNTVGF